MVDSEAGRTQVGAAARGSSGGTVAVEFSRVQREKDLAILREMKALSLG
jgi:hypothetical protein